MDVVSKERKHYWEQCKSSRDSLKALYTSDSGICKPPARVCCEAVPRQVRNFVEHSHIKVYLSQQITYVIVETSMWEKEPMLLFQCSITFFIYGFCGKGCPPTCKQLCRPEQE